MNRKITIVLLLSVLFSVSAFAELMFPEFTFTPYFGVEDTEIPSTIRNNQFYLESLRLNKLAQDTYDYGDYEASHGFAMEAVRFALLSDEFVSSQLIVEAKRLLDWADANDIPAKFPNNYNEGKNYYEVSVVAHDNEEWPESIDAAVRSIEILAAFEAGAPVIVKPTTTTTTTTTSGLPRQYTVRTWIVERDCLWNIAGYPWVYGDPWKWPLLYEANRSKLPEPDNPHLVEPGLVLDIPSLSGEAREGLWSPSSSSSTPSSNRPIQGN